jgi:hypothetical protein
VEISWKNPGNLYILARDFEKFENSRKPNTLWFCARGLHLISLRKKIVRRGWALDYIWSLVKAVRAP